MLKRADIDTGAAISALTAVNLLTFATLLALPVLALPAVLFGTSVPKDLTQGLWIALGCLVVRFAVGAVLLATDRPLRRLGRAIQAARNRLYRRREPLAGLPAKLVAERDLIMRALGRSWWTALGSAIGRWLLDFAALLVAVRAVGAHPSPALVLLAFVTAQVLAQIPVTPAESSPGSASSGAWRQSRARFSLITSAPAVDRAQIARIPAVA